MKAIGIWMDGQEAHVIRMIGEKLESKKVASDIEYHPRHKGGGKEYTRMGNSFFSDEQKNDRKFSGQKLIYFKDVADLIDHDYDLVVFGPGEVKKEFVHYLNALNLFRNKVVPLETTDKMTENQIIAWVKDYFSLHSERAI